MLCWFDKVDVAIFHSKDKHGNYFK